MKIINIIKTVPILLTLIIIIFLNISNQKESSKIKILVWSTPQLSLGTYIAISNITGFLLSYTLTTKLAKSNQDNIRKGLKYKYNSDEKDKTIYEKNNNPISYNNILIEREIKEPSPTINANFRVIGNINRKKQSTPDDYQNGYDNSDLYDDSENQFYKEEANYDRENEINSILNDWDDDSHLKW